MLASNTISSMLTALWPWTDHLSFLRSFIAFCVKRKNPFYMHVHTFTCMHMYELRYMHTHLHTDVSARPPHLHVHTDVAELCCRDWECVWKALGKEVGMVLAIWLALHGFCLALGTSWFTVFLPPCLSLPLLLLLLSPSLSLPEQAIKQQDMQFVIFYGITVCLALLPVPS